MNAVTYQSFLDELQKIASETNPGLINIGGGTRLIGSYKPKPALAKPATLKPQASTKNTGFTPPGAKIDLGPKPSPAPQMQQAAPAKPKPKLMKPSAFKNMMSSGVSDVLGHAKTKIFPK